MANTNNTFDLNKILQWANVIFMACSWWSFSINGPNDYVNSTTLWLGTLFSVEIFFFLLLERKRRDPFVLILCLQLVFYYVLRILTLSIYHFSVVFLRYPFKAANLNYALIFIIVANLAIFAGLYLNKVKLVTPPKVGLDYKPRKQFVVFWLLIFAYFITFPSLIGLGFLSGIIGLLTSIFLNISAIMLFIIIYIMVFNKQLTKGIKFSLMGGLFIYVLLATLTGSRSALITVSYLIIFSYLTVYGAIKIKRSYLIVFTLLIPALVLFFTLATYLRARLEDRSSVSGETLKVLQDFKIQESFSENSELILSPIFDRIGFLDYGAEIIANKEKYADVFSFKYYAKSLADNVLSPGFDIFDTALAANALTFIYNDMGTPQKSKEKDSYQSDEFTIYGEAYALGGGWFSIIPLFLISFALKRAYVKITDQYEFRAHAKRGIVIYLYFSLLNSFGLDWILFGAASIFFTYLLSKFFFKFTPLVSSNHNQ